MPRDYATLAWRRYFPPTTCSPEAMMIAETGDVCAEGGGGERSPTRGDTILSAIHLAAISKS